MSHANSNIKGAIYALLAMAIYASHDAIIKGLGETYSPVQIVFFASLLSFPVLSLFLLNDHHEGSLRPVHPWWVIARSTATVASGVLAFFAFVELPLAQVYPILFATPLFITIMAIPVLGEKVGLHRWAAVFLGLVGVLIVVRPGQAALGLGHLAALASAASGAFAGVAVRKIGHKERSVVLLLAPLLGNFLAMGAVLPFVWQPLQLVDLGLLSVVAGFGLIASFLMILAYRAGEAAIIAPMQYSQILWAVFYGWVLFGEKLDAPTVLGAALVIVSGLYIVFRESRTDVSQNTPVLRTRGRIEMATTPRSSLLQRTLNLSARSRDGKYR
ncbi:MAG: DMT family transporter [Paracoccaceae bacterium]|jgi:S-adenosylmethionine uptake transporter|nr:DMT family transporter [Paracoccaceae bacterium]